MAEDWTPCAPCNGSGRGWQPGCDDQAGVCRTCDGDGGVYVCPHCRGDGVGCCEAGRAPLVGDKP